MRTLMMVAFALLISLSSLAQDDTKAKALLNEVSQKVKDYKNITIDFKYVLKNSADNINQETRGDVVIEGNKYLLKILG
ncbi:MAG TPA: outer membrane lipoprotein carrier protein LolA, partial [Aquaticitalea sp.]|nr:outer membrane lipoprotein carrier protein LolA [Aquaticitalea sp.]